MSLLVFSSSNRIAQGVIRKIHATGNFEKIVCADLYPSYTSIQRFLNFQQELKNTSSNTKISDYKVWERSELAHAVQNCTHLLYVTHDYYSLTASKLNLIKTTAELAKKHKNVKKLVALTPVEHDHYGEANPVEAARASEKEALSIYPELVLLKSDLTFGPDSTVAHSLLTRLINGLSLAHSVKGNGPSVRPIHTEDVAAVAEAALADDSLKGKSYLLQGNENVSLADYLSALQKYSGKDNFGKSLLETVISPGGANFLTERLYDPSYSNLVRLLYSYKQPEKEGFEGIENFKASQHTLGSAYPAGSAQEANYLNKDGGLTKLVKNFLY